jgi:hypothetical protein
MANFLDEKRNEIEGRLRELQPAVDEYRELEKAAAALAGVGGNGSSTRRRRRTTSGSRPRRGRPRGSGARSKQALDLVRKRPGITIAELANAMGIKANYLYRVMPALASDGQVKKRGKGWHPA